MFSKVSLFQFLLLLVSAATFSKIILAGEEKVELSGELRIQRGQTSASDGELYLVWNSSNPLERHYELRYNGIKTRIELSEGKEIIDLVKKYGKGADQFQVLRSSGVYGKAAPIAVHLKIVGNKLERYSHRDRSKLTTQAKSQDKYPLKAQVQYALSTTPERAEFGYESGVTKKSLPIFETAMLTVDGKDTPIPYFGGEIPDVEETLRKVQESGDPSELRFVANFGPQSFEGRNPQNRRVPLNVVGTLVKDGIGYVVFYPPGENTDDPKRAYLVQEEQVTFVHDKAEWNRLNLKFKGMRASGGPGFPKQVFRGFIKPDYRQIETPLRADKLLTEAELAQLPEKFTGQKVSLKDVPIMVEPLVANDPKGTDSPSDAPRSKWRYLNPIEALRAFYRLCTRRK